MAKKDLAEIKKVLKTDKIIIGTKMVMKSLNQGKLDKIFISANCANDVEEDLSNHAKLSKLKVVKLALPNDELGVFCKKQFSISVLGITK